MTEEDVHQGGLAGAILAQKRDGLAALQVEGDGVIGEKRAETLGDGVEAQNGLRPGLALVVHQLDFGSVSLISTTKVPALMAASFSATIAMASAGTLPSKVPSGASEQPPSFMWE